MSPVWKFSLVSNHYLCKKNLKIMFLNHYNIVCMVTILTKKVTKPLREQKNISLTPEQIRIPIFYHKNSLGYKIFIKIISFSDI